MGNNLSSLEKKLDDIEKKVDRLDDIEKKVDDMVDRLDDIEKKVDRIDDRTGAFVEGAYRSRRPQCEYKEIVTAEDAVRLLFSCKSTPANVITKSKNTLVDRLYRHETRSLLAVICPNAGIDDSAWEKSAYKALSTWLDDNRKKMKNSEEYKNATKWSVVKAFAELLKPFDKSTSLNGLYTNLHRGAKETLLSDSSGLTLSLILAHQNVRRGEGNNSKCWAWRMLDFDGYEARTDHSVINIVTEIKSGGGLSTAKKQLKLRARFLGAVASCIKYKEIPHVVLVAAILKISNEDRRVNQAKVKEELDTGELKFDKIEQLTLETEYFRL